MDKLKPILAQKFWILSGLCLILAFCGWWMHTSGVAAEIDTRTKAIKTAFSEIPRPGPNKLWTDKVAAKNKEEETKVVKTGDMLWENQIPLMVWPEAVRAAVAKTTYRGPIDPTTRGKYRDAYEREMLDLYNVVVPFNDIDSKGQVMLAPETIPSEHLGEYTTHPSDKITWDAQEDIWLYRALLEAIARTNQRAGADSILNAVIKQLLVIELRGGTPKVPGAAGAASASGPKPGGAMHGGPMGMGPMGPMGPASEVGGASRYGQGGTGDLSVSFDPTEEFGSDADTSAGAAGGAMAGSKPMGPGAGHAAAPGPMGPGPMGPGPMSAGFGGSGTSTARKRYIEETKRYNTRGFYMEVVMDHRKLPEFLIELSDSPWPTKIVRVQQVDMDLKDIGSTVIGAGAGPGAMGSGPGPSPVMSLGAGAGAGHGGSRPAPPGPMGRPMTGIGSSEGTFRPRPMNTAGGTGEVGETAIDPNAALADPNLVKVALAGIITLYLPPEPVAPAPGTPGAATTPGAPTAPGTPAAPVAPGAATPGAPGAPATPVAPGTPMTPDAAATPATAPASGTAPAGPGVPAGNAPGTPNATAPAGTPTATPTAVPGTPGATAPAPAGTPAPAAPASGTPATSTPTAPATPGAPMPATTPPAAGNSPAAPAATNN